jgi:HEAT repeat protein
MTPAYDAAQRSRLGYDPGDIKPIYVALSLHAIGRDAVAPLINALSAEDKRIRFGAAMALESFRGFGDDVVPALIKALKDQDHNVRWRAARSLGSLQQLPDITVPALVESLAKDSDENVRCYVIFALKKFGLQASASIAELTKATSDPNAVIRSYAIDALKAIGPVQAARADAGQPAAGDYRLEDKAKSQR